MCIDKLALDVQGDPKIGTIVLYTLTLPNINRFSEIIAGL